MKAIDTAKKALYLLVMLLVIFVTGCTKDTTGNPGTGAGTGTGNGTGGSGVIKLDFTSNTKVDSATSLSCDSPVTGNWELTKAANVTVNGVASGTGKTGSFVITPGLPQPLTDLDKDINLGAIYGTTESVALQLHYTELSQRKRYFCNYGTFKADSCRFAFADSVWLPGPEDHNIYRFFPDGGAQLNGGAIAPNAYKLINGQTQLSVSGGLPGGNYNLVYVTDQGFLTEQKTSMYRVLRYYTH